MTGGLPAGSSFFDRAGRLAARIYNNELRRYPAPRVFAGEACPIGRYAARLFRDTKFEDIRALFEWEPDPDPDVVSFADGAAPAPPSPLEWPGLVVRRLRPYWTAEVAVSDDTLRIVADYLFLFVRLHERTPGALRYLK